MQRVRWTVGLKLAASVLALMLVMGITGWQSYRTAQQLQSQYEQIFTDSYPLTIAALKLQAQIHALAQHVMAYAATKESAQMTVIEQSQSQISEQIRFLEANAPKSPALLKNLGDIKTQWTKVQQMTSSVTQHGQDLEYSQLIYQAELSRATGEKLTQVIDGLVVGVQAEVNQARQLARASAQRAVSFLLGLVGLGCVGALLIAGFMQLVVARPIRMLNEQMARMAQGAGDLTQQIRIRSNDDVGLLSSNFNGMMQGIAHIVRQVVRAASESEEQTRSALDAAQLAATSIMTVASAMDQVAAGASDQVESTNIAKQAMGELVQAVDQLAHGAQTQAQHVQDTNFMVHQMVRETESVAQQSVTVSLASQEAAQTARKGAQILQESLQSLSVIQVQVNEASTKVQQLGRQGARIAEALRVIRSIAEQTNMLALNAAIEAARAGVHGRGFAVVAEEVRSLAAGASEATREIAELTTSILQGTDQAVDAMRQTTTEVQRGAELATQAEAGLGEILTVINQSDVGVASISDAATRLLTSCQSVSHSFQEVAAVTQENSAATEQMAAGASQVLTSIGDIFQVAEQNGRAVMDVAASMNHARSSMESITDSVSDLTKEFDRLRGLVSQFKV